MGFRTVALRALCLSLLTAPLPAVAAHCTEWSTSAPEVDLANEYYVDFDHCEPCMDTFWVYDESNGLPGLQRDDEIWSDTCHGMIAPDTVIF